LFNQPPTVTYNFMEQQLMLDIVLNMDDTALLDVKKMKELVREYAPKVTSDEVFDQIRDQLQAASMLSQAPAGPKAPAGPTELSNATAATGDAQSGDEEAAKKALEEAKSKQPADDKEEPKAKPIDV